MGNLNIHVVVYKWGSKITQYIFSFWQYYWHVFFFNKYYMNFANSDISFYFFIFIHIQLYYYI